VKLRIGTQEHVILSAALCVLQGCERWPFSANALNLLRRKGQDALYVALVASDTFPIVARAAQISGVRLSEHLSQKLAMSCRAADVVMNLLRPELARLASKMRNVSAQFLVFKSLDLADHIWPQVAVSSNGFDILVHPPQLNEVKSCLAEMGYTQGILDRNDCRLIPPLPEYIEALESAEPKLFPFSKLIRVPELDEFGSLLRSDYPRQEFIVVGGQVYMSCEVTVHHNVLEGVDVRDLWEKSRTIKVGEEKMLAQDPADMLWSLATRFYHQIMLDVARPIGAYLDVLAVLARFAPALDWDRVKLIANRYGLEPGLYYVLRHSKDLLGEEAIPANVLKLFHPTRSDVVRRRDWGDFIPRLFDRGVLYAPFVIEKVGVSELSRTPAEGNGLAAVSDSNLRLHGAVNAGEVRSQNGERKVALPAIG
jgi:hypothetical protein